MSWNYSGDPSVSPKDNVRFIIGDTEEDIPQVTDEEIEFALNNTESDVSRASILCVKNLVAKYAKAVDYKIGPESVSAGDRYTHYTSLLNKLEKDISQVGAAPSAFIPDTPVVFDIGMHDGR